MSIYWLIAVAVLNHTALSGSRMVASLQALKLGANPLEVGAVVGLFAVLPAVFSIQMGRASDRHPPLTMMLEGTLATAAGMILPAIYPSLPSLYVSATLIGMGFLRFQIMLQNLAGMTDDAIERTRNFSLLGLGFSVSTLVGPLAGGIAIDTAGFGWAWALLALANVAAVVMLVARRRAGELPRLAREVSDENPRLLDLLAIPRLRFVFIASAINAAAWDLHSFFVPIYGSQIGLSASQTGIILSAFAAATFVIRLFVTRLASRYRDHDLIVISIATAGVIFLLYPFAGNMAVSMLLSFILGLGLGMGQPLVLSMIHSATPEGRVGEATGIRQSIINSAAATMPILFGAVGSLIGLSPLLWVIGSFFATTSLLARRRRRRR